MREPDSLEDLLREWKLPEPTSVMDRRVASAYRSTVRVQSSPRAWRQFWTMRVSVPAPVLLVATLAVVILFVWLRPATAPPASPETPGAVTRLNASGFQPLPNGEARVIPAVEVQR
jgi:hypothetical protein